MVPILRCLALAVAGILSLAAGGLFLYKPAIYRAFLCSIQKWLMGKEAAIRLERLLTSEPYVISWRITGVGWILCGILCIIAMFIPAEYWNR